MSLTSPMLTRLGARLNTVVGVARPSTISLRASFSTEDSKEAAPSGPFKEVDSWTPPTTDLDKDLDVPDANGKAHVELLHGAPEEQLRRKVRIYKPVKHSMQSGTSDTQCWKLDFEGGERWSNPLMGWTSTSDPLTQLRLKFETVESAIAYAKKYNLDYEVEEPIGKESPVVPKAYADNFVHVPPRRRLDE